jgi:hypothetical protein
MKIKPNLYATPLQDLFNTIAQPERKYTQLKLQGCRAMLLHRQWRINFSAGFVAAKTNKYIFHEPPEGVRKDICRHS